MAARLLRHLQHTPHHAHSPSIVAPLRMHASQQVERHCVLRAQLRRAPRHALHLRPQLRRLLLAAAELGLLGTSGGRGRKLVQHLKLNDLQQAGRRPGQQPSSADVRRSARRPRARQQRPQLAAVARPPGGVLQPAAGRVQQAARRLGRRIWEPAYFGQVQAWGAGGAWEVGGRAPGALCSPLRACCRGAHLLWRRAAEWTASRRSRCPAVRC